MLKASDDWVPHILIAVIWLASIAITIALVSPSPSPIRLIGIGCDGAGGDLWAANDDDFPSFCERIERYQS